MDRDESKPCLPRKQIHQRAPADDFKKTRRGRIPRPNHAAFAQMNEGATRPIFFVFLSSFLRKLTFRPSDDYITFFMFCSTS